MPPAKALALIEPVLSALAAAHAAGLIHRDVKPENVLIADDGRVKVADFGLAQAVSADTQHTATGGVLIGTVSYLAPELVVDGRADARSDVYAAGVVLYELLTGRKPHEGESPIQVAYKHVHEDVPPPSARGARHPGVRRRAGRPRHRPRPRASARPTRGCCCTRCAGSGRRSTRASPTTPSWPPTWPRRWRSSCSSPSSRTSTPTAPTSRRSPRTRRTTPAYDVEQDREHTDPLEGATATRHDHDRPARAVAGARDPATPPAAGRRRPVPVRGARAGPAAARCCCWSRCCWPSVAARAPGGSASRRYTTTPGVIGLTAAQAEARMDKAGLGFEVGGHGVLRDRRRRARCISTDPERRRAGPRRRHRHRGGLARAPSATRCRSSRGDDRGRGPGRAPGPEPRASASSRADVSPRPSPRAASSAPTRRPAPAQARRHRRPRAQHGPRPIKVADWTGKDADKAEAALTQAGPRGRPAPRRTATPSPRATSSQQTPTRGTLFKGDKVELVVSQGPELVEVPRVVGMGVEDATETSSRTPASRSRSSSTPTTSASAAWSRPTPAQGDGAQGQHRHPLRRLTPTRPSVTPARSLRACPPPLVDAPALRNPVGTHVTGRQGARRRGARAGADAIGCETIQVFVGNPRGWALLAGRPGARTRAFRDACAATRACGCSSTRRTS